MSEQKIDGFELKPGFKGMASDTGSDQKMFNTFYLILYLLNY